MENGAVKRGVGYVGRDLVLGGWVGGWVGHPPQPTSTKALINNAYNACTQLSLLGQGEVLVDWCVRVLPSFMHMACTWHPLNAAMLTAMHADEHDGRGPCYD